MKFKCQCVFVEILLIVFTNHSQGSELQEFFIRVTSGIIIV